MCVIALVQESLMFMWYPGQYSQLEHSSYCDLVIEYLLLPMVDAADRLPAVEQRSFVYLMNAVFLGEYRKAITSNKRLYS